MSGQEPEAEQQIQQRIGWQFQRPELLRQALTHSSWARAQGADVGDNERLEFLGDAVLGLRVCERLSAALPHATEGELTRLRSWLVSARHLAVAAAQLDLGAFLRLSLAEEHIGGRGKTRLLANAMEAVIAAIHLDGGYAEAARFIDAHILPADLAARPTQAWEAFGYKSALQEWAHAASLPAPAYRVLEAAGPEHNKIFTVEVEVGARVKARGKGASKKEAEQNAAQAAMEHLQRAER
ncbi:MAG: ribonuclease III [Terriglobales bacterium]